MEATTGSHDFDHICRKLGKHIGQNINTWRASAQEAFSKYLGISGGNKVGGVSLLGCRESLKYKDAYISTIGGKCITNHLIYGIILKDIKHEGSMDDIRKWATVIRQKERNIDYPKMGARSKKTYSYAEVTDSVMFHDTSGKWSSVSKQNPNLLNGDHIHTNLSLCIDRREFSQKSATNGRVNSSGLSDSMNPIGIIMVFNIGDHYWTGIYRIRSNALRDRRAKFNAYFAQKKRTERSCEPERIYHDEGFRCDREDPNRCHTPIVASPTISVNCLQQLKLRLPRITVMGAIQSKLPRTASTEVIQTKPSEPLLIDYDDIPDLERDDSADVSAEEEVVDKIANNCFDLVKECDLIRFLNESLTIDSGRFASGSNDKPPEIKSLINGTFIKTMSPNNEHVVYVSSKKVEMNYMMMYVIVFDSIEQLLIKFFGVDYNHNDPNYDVFAIMGYLDEAIEINRQKSIHTQIGIFGYSCELVDLEDPSSGPFLIRVDVICPEKHETIGQTLDYYKEMVKKRLLEQLSINTPAKMPKRTSNA